MKVSQRYLIILLSCLLFSLQSWAEQIAVIGDSHSCGDFGKALVNSLVIASGSTILLVASGGLAGLMQTFAYHCLLGV